MPQPNLVLLLVWVQDKANVYAGATNTNARAANGDTHATALSSTAHIHTGTLTLSRTTHIHVAKLVEQLTDDIPERSASQGRAFAWPEAGVYLFAENSVKEIK